MRRVVICMLLALLCTVPCQGAEKLEVPGLDKLWDQAEDYGVEQGTDLDSGLSNLFSDALNQVGGLLRSSAATGLKLLAVVLLCSLAESVRPPGEKEGLQAAEVAGALSITALTMTDMAAMIGLGRDTIGRMDLFSQTLLPVMAVLTAATGGVSTAAVHQGATVFFAQLLITAMDRLLIPLIYAYVAASCAYAAAGNPGLQKLAGLMKSAATFLLTALLLAFVGYLTASGAIAGSVDASAEGSQAGDLPGHTRGGRHFSGRLGDGAGRSGCAEGERGRRGDAGCAGHLHHAVFAAGAPVPGLQGVGGPVRRCGTAAAQPAD